MFASTDTATIIDRHDFDGDMLDLIEEAQKYILKNIHIGMRIEGLYRVDVPEISTEALREAVINAFCHRDWRDPDYVQVAIFKDRVEIRNPGQLYGGLTIEDLRRGNVSRRRNPLIADLFRRIEMVEAWGRGMPLILQKAPSVQFREVAGLFIASFGRPSFVTAGMSTTPEPQENHQKTPRNPFRPALGRRAHEADRRASGGLAGGQDAGAGRAGRVRDLSAPGQGHRLDSQASQNAGERVGENVGESVVENLQARRC